MPSITVVNMEGSSVGTIDLAESVFGIEPNAAVMHQMVVSYLANQRQGTQSALTRSEAVETEGHRPRKTGFDKSSPVDTRRHRVRSQAQKLPLHSQQEGKTSRYEVRFLD